MKRKTPALAAVARAHRAAGRDLIVTSTGGLAVERLAGELAGSVYTIKRSSEAPSSLTVELLP